MRITAVIALLLALGACSTTTPTVQQGADAEITFDGLHRVNDTLNRKVWIKPEIDLSQYDKIMFEGAGIHYREAESKSRYDRSASSFALDARQKERLEKAVSEVMVDEMQGIKNYAITEEAGPGVLKVSIALIDVISRIPPELTSARSEVYLDNLGSAVFVVEVADSNTNEVLARTVDGRNVQPVVMQESNPVTNTMEVKRSVRVWGSRLRSALDDLHEIGCYVCAVPGTTEG
jgi:hypothetical protein